MDAYSLYMTLLLIGITILYYIDFVREVVVTGSFVIGLIRVRFSLSILSSSTSSLIGPLHRRDGCQG